MKKKKQLKYNDVPYLDLSKYAGRPLSIRLERIVVNLLCIFESDVDEVIEHTKLTREDVEKVYLTHYIAIRNLVDLDISSKKIISALNDIVDLDANHIAEVKKQLKASNTKLMNDKLCRNMNTIADKLIMLNNTNKTIKANAMKEAMKDIINSKALELEERIKLPDEAAIEYSENNKSVFDKLLTYSEEANTERIVDRTITKQTVRLTNTETGEELIFGTVTDAAKYLGEDYRNMAQYKGCLYKNKFLVEYIEDIVG